MTDVDLLKKYSGKFVLIKQTPQVIALTTIIRDQKTCRGDFVFYSDRLFRLLMEEALAYFPYATSIVSTPLSTELRKVQFKVCFLFFLFLLVLRVCVLLLRSVECLLYLLVRVWKVL